MGSSRVNHEISSEKSDERSLEAGLLFRAVEEGRDLLLEVGYTRRASFSDSNHVRVILQNLHLENTSLAVASIEEVPNGNMSDVYEKMQGKIKDEQGKDTFHIWFARKNGKWILKFCQIPQSNT